MANESRDLRDLVLAEFPLAKAVYDIASQLAPMIPIDSLEGLLQALGKRPLTLNNAKLSADQLRSVLPKAAFPITDHASLVRRVAGAARVASELAASGAVVMQDAQLATVIGGLAREPLGRAAVSTGFFGGPSLFGGEAPAKKGGR